MTTTDTTLNNGKDVTNASGNRYIQFLTFKVGKELYGMPVEHVKEVIEFCKIYKVPQVPDYISGVINLRGEVLPVVSLSCLFYGKRSDISNSTGIMFVEARHANETVIVGAVIDSVEAVVDIAANNINESPPFGSKIRLEYIHSVGKIDDQFVIILDISNVFDIEHLSKFKDR